MGEDGARAMAWSDGSNAFQSLDLPAPEALRGRAGDGACRQDEGDQRGQKEERQDRRADHRGPAAVQSVSGLLRDRPGTGRIAATAAVSAAAGTRTGRVQEQHGGIFYERGGGIRTAAAAWQAIF